MSSKAPIGPNGRYLPQRTIGAGTYGHVLYCVDAHNSNSNVAVKVSHKPSAYRRSALNEVHVLDALRGEPSVIQYKGHFEEDGRIMTVVEVLHKNLYESLRDHNFSGFEVPLVRHSAKTVLTALTKLHNIGYMHCDIKPENVMFRSPKDTNDICLIDFGSVRRVSENAYFDIQSMWYRAPEVICGVEYTPAIDSWSVGCLLAELYSGSPLFPGDSPQHQLSQITEALGPVSYAARNHGKYSHDMQFHDQRQHAAVEKLSERLKLRNGPESASFVDFLLGILNPDETLRWSVGEALGHPFITEKEFEGFGVYNDRLRGGGMYQHFVPSTPSFCGMTASTTSSPDRAYSQTSLFAGLSTSSSSDAMVYFDRSMTPPSQLRLPPVPIDLAEC